MTESSSFIDSSFVLIGTEQSQALQPSRPPTVTSDTTFPSSISTPTSPIDSNVSCVGNLEVLNHFLPLRLSPPDSPYFLAGASPFCRCCLCRGVHTVLCPRLVSGYDWRHSHARKTLCRRVWARVQPSWGEPLGELQDVRPPLLPYFSHFMPHPQPRQRQSCQLSCWC